MSFMTYADIKEKVQADTGTEDEDFVKSSEMMGYCNDAIAAAEAMIHDLYEDYFLSYAKLALIDGQSLYDLPSDIYANKVRGITYNDGQNVYPIRRLKERNKFEIIQDCQNFNYQEYRYFLVNRNQNNSPVTKIQLLPKSHETMPLTAKWVAGTSYYKDDIVYYNEHRYKSILPALWIASTSYVIGDEVNYNGRKYSCITDNSDASFTVANWTDLGIISVETTFTVANWTDLGEETFYVTIFYFRKANRMESDSSICDIPEGYPFVVQYMKNEVYKKENNGECPQTAILDLQNFKDNLEAALTNMIPDSDTDIEADTTFYDETV